MSYSRIASSNRNCVVAELVLGGRGRKWVCYVEMYLFQYVMYVSFVAGADDDVEPETP